MEKEKWKLSIADYYKREKNGKTSNNSKTPLDPRLKTIKKLSNVKPLELKLVKWAPRINDPHCHLTQYIRPSPVLQRRNSEPGKLLSTQNSCKPFNSLKRKIIQEQPSFPISFPSSSDILAKSRDSLKSASYVVTSGKMPSDSLKRHFVSNGGNLVPLPYKRTRWSIESMDSTESVASETANSKSNLDDNQSSVSRSSCTDKTTAFVCKTKLSKQHSKELVNPNPTKDSVKGFTKKNLPFTNASDQPGPSGKNLANSSCIQLSKEKYPFSETPQSVDTRSNVFKSTSSNVLNAVTSSPKRKLIITPDARLIIEKEYKKSSPKRKDTLPNAKFFIKNKYRCSSPKRNAFPSPNASLVKKRKLEYQSKLYQKSTNKKNFKANLSNVAEDKELSLKAVQKKDSLAPLVNKTPEKRKSVKSSSEPSYNLDSSTALSLKDFISPNKSLIKEQKHESSSKPFQNLFDERTMDAKPNPKPMGKNEDLPIINEKASEKRKLVKSSSVSSNAGNYLSLSNAWSQKRNSSITSDASFIEKRKSGCNSKPLQMSMDQRKQDSKVKKSEFGFKPKQNDDNLASTEKRIVEKSKPVKLQNSTFLQKSMDLKNPESKVKKSELSFKSKQKTDEVATTGERIVEKSKPVNMLNSKPLQNSMDQKSQESKVKKSELSFKSKQKTDEVATNEERIVEKSKPVKSSTDSIANYLALHNAWSQKRNVSITSNTNLNKKKKSECNLKPYQKSIDPESKSNPAQPSQKTPIKPTQKTDEVATTEEKIVEKSKPVKSSTDPIANYLALHNAWSQKRNITSNASSIKKRKSECSSKPFQKPVDQKNLESKSSGVLKKSELGFKLTQKTENVTIIDDIAVEQRTCDTQKTNDLAIINKKTVEKRTSVKSKTEVLKPIKTDNLDIIGKRTAKKRKSNQSSSVSLQKTNDPGNCNALPVEEKSGKTSKNSVSPLIKSNSPVKKNCAQVEQLDYSVSAEKFEKNCSGKSGKADNDSQLKSLRDSTKENIKSPISLKSQSQVSTKKTHKVKSKKKRKPNMFSSKGSFEVLKKISKFRRIYKMGSKYKKNKVNIKKKHLKNSMNIVQTLDDTVKPKSRRQSMESVIKINEEDSKDIQSPEFWHSGVERVVITNVRHFPESNFQLMSDCEKSLIKERCDIVSPFDSTNDSKVSENSGVVITDVRHFPESNFQLMSDCEEGLSIQERSGIVTPFDSTNYSKVSENSGVLITDVRHFPESNFQFMSDCEESLSIQERSGIVSPFDSTNDYKVSENSGVVITDVRHFPESNFQLISDWEGSLNIHEEGNTVTPFDCTSDYQRPEESGVVITDVRYFPENNFQHFIPDCEGVLNVEQKEEINLISSFTCTNNQKVSEKSVAQCVPSTTPSIRNEDTCSSEFNTDFKNKVRKSMAKKSLVLSYKKYKNGKMAILMLDFKNQTCKRIPLTHLFATKTVLSTGLPVEVLKKSLYGPSILNALSIECCVGFILSEVFFYKAGADDKCSAITRHCVVFFILRHLKIHSQCEVHNLLFKFVKGYSKEFKLKTSWIHLQKLSKIILKGIVKSGHCKSHKKKSKSSYLDDSFSEPCSFKCSNVPFIDRFLDSFNSVKYTDTFSRTFLSSKKLFCASCLLNYDEFCREYRTGVISGRLLENRSMGLGHNPRICAHLCNLRNICKDSFYASLKKKGISFNVLKKCENLIDLGKACFLETKWVSNVLNCLPYIRSLENMPFSLFYNVFISTHQGFHETPKEPFSFLREDKKSAFYFIFSQASFVKNAIGTYSEDSTNMDCTNLTVDSSNNCCNQKYLLAINSLKHASVDLFTNVYESVSKLITSQKSMLTLFPPGSNTPEPPLKVSSSHINEMTCINYEPEPSHVLDPTEGAKEVNEKVLQEIPQNSDVDTSIAIDSLKSPCVGNLLFFHKRNLTLHCTKDYDDMFLPLDLFKKGSVLSRYYDHLRKTGPHELGFSFVHLSSMSKENMESFNYLRDQLNYHKYVLQGLISIASEPGKETSHDIIKRITEQLETIAGYEVACKALLL